MRKLFLAAVGSFLAASAQADTPPATTTAPATMVVTDGTYAATGSQPRRGLFSRLRNRGMRSTTPTTYAAPMTTTTTPAAPAVPAPTPMPMGKVSSDTPQTSPSGVVQTGGATPMTATGTVVPASSVVPMTSTTTRPMMRLAMFCNMRVNR